MAWKSLYDPQVAAQFDMEGIEALARTAGFKEEEVQKFVSERAWQRMKRDLPL